MVDASETLHGETTQRRGKKGQPSLRPDAVPGCTQSRLAAPFPLRTVGMPALGSQSGARRTSVELSLPPAPR